MRLGTLLFIFLTPFLLLEANTAKRYYEHFVYAVQTDQSMDEARAALDAYLKNADATIVDLHKSVTEEMEQLEVGFSVSDDKKEAIFKLLETIGKTSLTDFKKINYEDEIVHLRYHKALLEDIQKQYKEEFKIFQNISDKESMRDTIAKMRATANEIYEIQKEIKQLSRDTTLDHYRIAFAKIYPKKVIRAEDNETALYKFSPSGVALDFTLINVETPKDGYSSPLYSGYEISYLFNKDETIFKISSLSALPAPTSAKQMQKIFMYSYGQNFFPKEFRSGDNVFAYLYSGFDIGGYMATSVDKTAQGHMFVSTHIGYELFKNDFISMDAKLAYFIPFGVDELLNFRGIKYNISAKVILD